MQISPKRYEATAREIRRIAQRLIDAENISALLKQAEQLEAKAAEIRQRAVAPKGVLSLSPERGETR